MIRSGMTYFVNNFTNAIRSGGAIENVKAWLSGLEAAETLTNKLNAIQDPKSN